MPASQLKGFSVIFVVPGILSYLCALFLICMQREKIATSLFETQPGQGAAVITL